MSDAVLTGQSDVVLSCEALGKTYLQGESRIRVLDGVELVVHRGERVAIVGASGSGKSTLLNLLGGLDAADSGSVTIDQRSLAQLDDRALSALRNQSLGFVYQFHHLLAEFSALENVAMPLFIAGVARTDAEARAAELLAAVGLSARGQHRPAQLSGGERQRVAIARALANAPACVLMDEPTGNLDRDASETIQQLTRTLSVQFDTAFVIVTHDPQVAATMDKVYELADGRLQQVSQQA